MIFFSAIIPVFNEQGTILEVLKRLKKAKLSNNLEVIVVNDGSNDDTLKILNKNKQLFTKLINLENNSGKGTAVIEGLKNSEGKYVFIQDADLEYDPIDLKKFILKLKESNFEIIMGSRFISSERSVLHFWHMLGNKFITLLFNLFNNTAFSDIYCCYCLFKKENLNIKKLKSKGWGQQAEILTYIVSNSKKILEIGVNYDARTYKDGKKIRYMNVFEVIYWIIITRFKLFF